MKKDTGEKTSRFKIAIVVLESILILCFMVITFFYAWIQNDKMGFVKTFSKSAFVRMYLSNTIEQEYENKVQDTDFNKENITTNQELSPTIETYRNIALFGIDSRDETFDKNVHSDTIIVVSINNKTGEVKMASVYRDTMLKMADRNGKDYYTKANAAFFMGGAENAINMLNVNLDLNITDYAVVNFTGLTKIIDALGGIDVNITPQEKFYINGYLVETREITGLDAPDVTESGAVHLSGLQATAYCRIRYVTFTDEDGTEYNNDMGRTARQRSVIKKLVSKAKLAGVNEVMAVADEILNYGTQEEKIITTSLSFDEIMDLIPVMIDFELTETFGFPYTFATPEIKGASMVVPRGLSYSVMKLHEALFDEKDYMPSKQVEKINDYIIKYTGIKTQRLEEDMDEEDEPADEDDEEDYNKDEDYDENYNEDYDETRKTSSDEEDETEDEAGVEPDETVSDVNGENDENAVGENGETDENVFDETEVEEEQLEDAESGEDNPVDIETGEQGSEEKVTKEDSSKEEKETEKNDLKEEEETNTEESKADKETDKNESKEEDETNREETKENKETKKNEANKDKETKRDERI